MNHEKPSCESCPTREFSSFRMCRNDELEDLKYTKTCNSYEKGQNIFSENSQPVALYCISRGNVKLVKYGAGGKEQILRIAKPGDFLGYRSLISGHRYNLSAVTLDETSVCVITRKDFEELMANNEGFRRDLFDKIFAEAEETESKLTDLAYKPAKGRIADVLILLSNMAEEQNKEVKLSREELAGMAGTVKETAIRILSDFKKEDLIKINKRSIEVVNFDGLMRMSSSFD